MRNENVFNPNLIVLYSRNVEDREAFYQKILRSDPIARFDGFSLFQINDQIQLGIQSESDILPKPDNQQGGFELCMSDVSISDVDKLCDQWKSENLNFILEPQHLEFGYTAVVVDPDGYRVRVCATDTTNIIEK